MKQPKMLSPVAITLITLTAAMAALSSWMIYHVLVAFNQYFEGGS